MGMKSALLMQAAGGAMHAVKNKKPAEALAQNAGNSGIDVRQVGVFIMAGGEKLGKSICRNRLRPPAISGDLLGFFHVKKGGPSLAFEFKNFCAAQLAL